MKIAPTGPSFEKPIPIIYEDHEIVIFDKPAGLLVIPTAKNEINTLVNIVNHQYAKSDEAKLHPCHRLDQETSGLIIFALGKHNQKLMMDLFAAHKIHKTYVAFVYGQVKKGKGEFHSAIRSLEDAQHSEAFLPAITRYQVVERKKDFTMVEAEPVTGRTNQIRIHFSEHDHPLVGERKYAIGKDQPFRFRRVALHASYLKFNHPVTRQQIRAQSPLPKDMEELRARN